MQTKDHLTEKIKEMQSKLTQSHTSLNGMFREQVTKMMEVQRDFEKQTEELTKVESVNKVLDQRTLQHGKQLESLQKLTSKLQESK